MTAPAGHARSVRPARLLRRPDSSRGVAGVGFGVVAVIPALLATAWLVTGVPLLLFHAYRPAWAVLAAVPVFVLLVLGTPWRRVDGPAWALALTLVVVALATAWAWTHSSENIVVRRDPGPYALTSEWVAEHGTLEIPTSAGVFGHSASVAYDSPGFYTGPGDTLQPQFMSGPPLALAPAAWVGGLRGVFRGDAVVGGLALLAFAGFSARLLGPRITPFATAVLALAYPETHAFRSVYSEPLAQLLVFGGLALLWDATTGLDRLRDAGVLRRVGLPATLVAGVVLGAMTIARIDGIADLLPLAAAVLLLAVLPGRHPPALAAGLMAGLAGAAGVAVADGRLLHDRYVHMLDDQLSAVTKGGILVLVLLVGCAPVGRRVVARRLRADRPGSAAGWWTRRRAVALGLAALVPVLGVLAYVLRPVLSHPMGSPGSPVVPEIAQLQRMQGLPVNGRRSYAEYSLHWLGWWVGVGGLVLAALGAAWLAYRLLRGRRLQTLPFVALALAVTALVLWQPAITPDHPWADRRFVPIVLPGVVLFACWLVSRLARRGAVGVVAAVLGAAVLLVGTLAGTAPLAWSRTETGQLAAVREICSTLPPDAAVVMLDDAVAFRLAQTVRELCDVPTARLLRGTAPAMVADVTPAVTGSGHGLWLLAGAADELPPGAAAPTRVHFDYPVDARRLAGPPHRLGSEQLDVYLAAAAAG